MKRMIFVDDDQFVLTLIEKKMRHSGIECLFTSFGQEAIEWIKTLEVDVIVSDIVMPDINGIELLDEVRRISPKTVRIMLSGNANTHVILDAINICHVHEYLHKPFVFNHEGIKKMEGYVALAKKNKARKDQDDVCQQLLKHMSSSKENIDIAISSMDYEIFYQTIETLPIFWRDYPYKLFIIEGRQYRLYEFSK